MVALYDTNGVLITNSAVAGVLSAGANAFQSIAFLTQPILTPGRYFVAVQCNGTTATTRRWAAANGGNQMTQSAAGTFGTVPASFTRRRLSPPTLALSPRCISNQQRGFGPRFSRITHDHYMHDYQGGALRYLRQAAACRSKLHVVG